MGKRKKPPHASLPLHAAGDARLTALDFRCLMTIAYHDRFSLHPDNQEQERRGCYASSRTMAARVGTDVTNFSKSVSKLVKLGYVTKKQQASDKRLSVLRIIYPEADSWRDDQPSGERQPIENVGDSTNHSPEIVGEATNEEPEIVGDANSENGSFLRVSGGQETPLRGERNLPEGRKETPPEVAHFAEREMRAVDFSISDLPGHRKLTGRDKHPRKQVSIINQLGETWGRLEPEAQLCRFEREFAAIGRSLAAVSSAEFRMWSDYLFALGDDYAGTPISAHATRLLSEIEGQCVEWPHPELLTPEQRRAWLKASVKAIGSGAQTKIAEAAGLKYSIVHRFLHGHRLADGCWPALREALEHFLPLNEWQAVA